MLTDSGDVYTWGINEQGVLGLGMNEGEKITTPTKVDIGEPIKSIQVNPNTNSIFAITTQGDVYVWGPNHYSIFPGVSEQVLSNPEKLSLPFKVANLSHSYRFLTIEDTDGNYYGCGWDGSGGTVLDAEMQKSVSSSELIPLWSGSSTDITDFCNAGLYRVLLDSDGQVHVRGRFVDSDAALTYDDFTSIVFPEPITDVKPLFQGMVCLSDSGTLYFIGEDRYGIASDVELPGEVKTYYEPVKVSKTTEVIADLYASTSSIVVQTEQNDFYSWGYNVGRNVAESENEFIIEPNKLGLVGDIRYLSCGEFSGVVIGSDGAVYAWGSNGYCLFMEEDFSMQYTPKILDIASKL